jgi:hypothetical protein
MAGRAVEVANIYGNMALMLQQVGAIIMHLVMPQSVYGQSTGALVTVAGTMTFIGTLDIVFRPLSFFTLLGLMLAAFWQVPIGIKLDKLGIGEKWPAERPRDRLLAEA